MVAAAALFYTFRGDRRKTGMDIRYRLAIMSAVSASERWVSEVTLQNAKDRAVTIYKIYLEIGHGAYIELEDFSHKPLILEPYGLYQQQYEPIDFYVGGSYRCIDVLGDKKGRRRLVLVTAQGRYFPKRCIKFDDPLYDSISTNYTACLVRPMRLKYEGKCYGSEVKYIVTLTYSDGEKQIVPIYPRDHELKRFRDIGLTELSMGSKQELEDCLNAQVDAGALKCADVSVFDPEPARRRWYEEFTRTTEVPVRGWFAYNVAGRCWTLRERWRLYRINKQSRKYATDRRST